MEYAHIGLLEVSVGRCPILPEMLLCRCNSQVHTALVERRELLSAFISTCNCIIEMRNVSILTSAAQIPNLSLCRHPVACLPSFTAASDHETP